MPRIVKRRKDLRELKKLLSLFPVTALLGPRQSGKSFLARQMNFNHYFDLENPRDLARLETPQLALEDLKGLIVIDEVQRVPGLFALLRHLADNRPEQKYLLLGSASGELLRQSSESLAGRIGYHELGGFSLADVGSTNWKTLWLRGGLPRSYLARTPQDAALWLTNYVTTFLERDIPHLGLAIPANSMRRFWMMLSHYHGQIANFSDIGNSLDMTDVTARRYLDILESAFMIRVLRPWHVNTKKRLVKRPKIYFRDSGLLHSLLSVSDHAQLATHPRLGASWEGFALECAVQCLGKSSEELFFWATHSGAEVDLFWKDGGRNWAIEVKYSDAPVLTPSMRSALRDLDLTHLWVLYPGDSRYRLDPKVSVLPLKSLSGAWDYAL